MLEQQIFSKAFITNLTRVFAACELPRPVWPEPETPPVDQTQRVQAELLLKYATNYLYYILPYAEESADIQLVVDKLEAALQVLAHKALTFFVDHIWGKSELVINLLLTAGNASSRTAIAQYLSSVLLIVTRHYKLEKLEDQGISQDLVRAYGSSGSTLKLSDEQREQWAPKVAAQGIYNFVVGLVTLSQNPTQNNMRKLGHYFRCMHRLASLSKPLCQLLVFNNFVTNVNDGYFILDNKQSYVSDRVVSPLIYLHASLFKHLIEMIRHGDDREKVEQYYNHHSRPEFFEKLFREDPAVTDAVEELVRTVAEEDKRMTDIIASIALRHAYKEPDIVVCTCALMALLRIDDSLSEYRLHRVLGVPRLQGENHRSDRYLYGLAHQTRLKGQIYAMPTLYFNERGFLELLTNFYESKLFIAVVFLSQAAVRCPRVFDYLLTLPPLNYLDGCIFSTFPDMVRRHVNRSVYDSAKSDTKVLTPMALHTMELLQTAVAKLLPNENIRLFVSDDDANREPLFLFRKSYLVGKTISSRLVHEHRENSSEKSDKFLGLRVFIDRVSLMESIPTGSQNLALPEDYDFG